MDDTLLHKALHMAGTVACQVKSDDMGKPTPCTEWDVQMLLNHMLYEAAWIAPLLAGKTIAEVGDKLEGDLIKNDPDGSWHKYAAEAMDVAKKTPADMIVHLSYADKLAGDYLGEVGADLVVHGWDLAQAVGVTYMIDEATSKECLEAVKELLPLAREGGLVGPAIPTAIDATPAERLLAAYGRSIKWSPAV